MFRWVVVEVQQRVTVLDQLDYRLVPFDAVGLNEEIEGGVRFGLRRGLKMAFGLSQNGFRHRIQNVQGFMDPAPLFLRRSKNLTQRRPKPQGTFANGQFGGFRPLSARLWPAVPLPERGRRCHLGMPRVDPRRVELGHVDHGAACRAGAEGLD